MASGSFTSSLCTAAGVLNGTDYSRYIEVEWNSTNDITNNKSTITWNAYIRAPDPSTTSWVEAKQIVITINGVVTTLVGSTAIKTYKDSRIGGGTIIVDHSNNGRKSVDVSITAQFFVYGSTNSSYYGTITMTPNPVYTLSISAGTGSNITINRTACSGSGGTGNLSSGTKKLYYGDKLKITFTPSANYAIDTHTVNGSSFTSGNTLTVSGNVTVAATAIPLKSVIGAIDADIESYSVITVTRYNTSYTHTITYRLGSATGTIVTKSKDTSISWQIPVAFYAQIPNAKTGICTLTCETFNSGGTSLGTSTCTLEVRTNSEKCKPSIVATVVDNNEITKALTGDETKLIRYKSTALCTLTATPKNSASMYELFINGGIVNHALQNGVATATKTISSVENDTFSFAARDSRLYRTTITKSPIMVKYVKLTCNPDIVRVTPTGSSIVMAFTGNVYRGSFGRCNNTLTLQYRYQETGGSYCSWKTINSEEIIFGTNTYRTSFISAGDDFDYQKNYIFQVRVTDGGTVDGTEYTLSSVTKTVVVKRGIPIYDWGEEDFNINVPLKLNAKNIMDIMYPVGAVYMHSSSTLPTAISDIGEWTSITTGISGVYAWKRTK